MKCTGCGDDSIELKCYLYGAGVALLCTACADEKGLVEADILPVPEGYVVVGKEHYQALKAEKDSVAELALKLSDLSEVSVSFCDNRLVIHHFAAWGNSCERIYFHDEPELENIFDGFSWNLGMLFDLLETVDLSKVG